MASRDEEPQGHAKSRQRAPATDPSRAELVRAGLEARRRVTFTELARWKRSRTRADPVDLIAGQAATRLPQLVPVRHTRMSASPFAYYRGAALPMASDLASRPHSGITVQLGGDAHLANFGLFAAPDRTLLFDMNDFDETLEGPWEWDLKRLAASLVIAGRYRRFSAHDCRHAAHVAVRTYRERMHEYADMGAMAVFYSRVDVASVMDFIATRARPYLEITVKAAAHHDALAELSKLTEIVDGRRRLVDRPPLIYHPDEVEGLDGRHRRARSLSAVAARGSPLPASIASVSRTSPSRSWASGASASWRWSPSSRTL